MLGDEPDVCYVLFMFPISNLMHLLIDGPVVLVRHREVRSDVAIRNRGSVLRFLNLVALLVTTNLVAWLGSSRPRASRLEMAPQWLHRTESTPGNGKGRLSAKAPARGLGSQSHENRRKLQVAPKSLNWPARMMTRAGGLSASIEGPNGR